MRKLKILFVSPVANRSGAPLFLLDFISWGAKQNHFDPILLLSSSGKLDDNFKTYSKVFHFYQNRFDDKWGLASKLYCRLYNSNFFKKLYLLILQQRLIHTKADLIYSNTIVTGALLEFTKFLKKPVITHVHESNYLTSLYGLENIQQVKLYTSLYIACSNHVKHSLVNSYHLDDKLVRVLHTPINATLQIETEKDESLIKIKALAQGGKQLIGGSGGLGWIKGSDLLIPLMIEIIKKNKDVYFVWVGGDSNSIEYKQLMIDIKNADLCDYVLITGNIPNPNSYFSILNLFVLLSREDSFPLVCLENSILSKPIVCFDKSGGATELLSDIPANIIPYLNLQSFAMRVIELLDNQNLALEIGTSLKKRVLSKFTSDLIYPKIIELINNNSSI